MRVVIFVDLVELDMKQVYGATFMGEAEASGSAIGQAHCKGFSSRVRKQGTCVLLVKVVSHLLTTWSLLALVL